ncbi:anti-sigma factor [Granulosicoccus sp. 3-233]|uniref:anti-sigma factor n=1 Tax=Granulosicoccus sp. 3-233 TaxID=3417969 RepID=UPI003D34CCE6
MATPDEQWWEAQAGEYVLGSLRGTERDVFEKILAADEETRARVRWWQHQLAALDSRVAPVTPPPHLLPLIMSRIGTEKHAPGDTEQEELTEQLTTDAVRQDTSDNVVSWRRRPSRRSNTLWKTIAGLATAASIAMAALLLQSTTHDETVAPGPELNMISIVQDDSQESLWILSTRDGSNQLQVVALAPPPLEADRSFELWMVKPDDGGVSSVGLLPTNEGESLLLTLPLGTAEAQQFAVSLEPSGGSPEAGPTGPVLFSGAIRTISGTRL